MQQQNSIHMDHDRLEYEAFHVHSAVSNALANPDSPTSIRQYADAFRQRDMHVLCLTEHGNRSNVWEQFEIAETFRTEGYRITPLAAAEAYFVPVRDPALRDSRNFRLILIAKNQEGFYQLNECLSEANISGFYGKARVDFDLLDRLDHRNFLCTTAGADGIFMDSGYERLFCQLREIMRDSLYIEVQHHPQEQYKRMNMIALSMYRKYGVPLIYGTDSRYIRHEDAILREELLRASGTPNRHRDEPDLYLPTACEAFALMKQQGIFSTAQIEEAMENTLILRTFDGVSFSRERRMPTCRPDLTVDQRNKLFRRMVCEGYIQKEGLPTREEAAEIHREMDTITQTNTADYFLILKEILERGKRYGGLVTQTSRGSAASFVTNYALGFTTINRLHCPVTLYPERFLSKDRLAAHSMPDIDINLSNVEAFERAGKEILGEYGCLPMIAYGTNKTLSAFRMLARARNIAPEIVSKVSKQLRAYQSDLKRASDTGSDDPDHDPADEISIDEYVDKQYLPLVTESRRYHGIIVSMLPHRYRLLRPVRLREQAVPCRACL